jgi:polyhydroxyalkanoate synthesis regulator phasin
MNSNNPIELLQQGFRISVGATASLIETLQDAQKREENLSKLTRLELSQLAQEWAEKGEVTEQVARNYVESLLRQQTNQTPPPTSPTTTTSSPFATTATSDMQRELQDLTAQLAAMRAELEKMSRDS